MNNENNWVRKSHDTVPLQKNVLKKTKILGFGSGILTLLFAQYFKGIVGIRTRVFVAPAAYTDLWARWGCWAAGGFWDVRPQRQHPRRPGPPPPPGRGGWCSATGPPPPGLQHREWREGGTEDAIGNGDRKEGRMYGLGRTKEYDISGCWNGTYGKLFFGWPGF